MTSDKTFLMLTASFISGIGPAKLKELSKILLNEISNETELYKILEYISSNSKRIRLTKDSFSNALAQAEKQTVLAKDQNINIISSLDPQYPILIKKSSYDPSIIFNKGNINNLNKRAVGVIGTRSPTNHGAIIAYRIAKYLAEHNISVISGLALGCDSYGHKGALDANGHTVAVMAHGLDMVAPTQNKNLAEKILNNDGALISTYPIGTKPSTYTFAARDKIQAGLSEMIVMVQSGLNGGSLIASSSILLDQRKLIIPEPTKTDKECNCEQIQANLVFIRKEFQKLKNFDSKKISPELLVNNITILHSKEEYEKIFGVK